jgi:hypothetical protein
LTLQHFTKEPFSSPLVPSFRHPDIQDVAVLVDSTPEIALLSLNLDADFINIPSIAQSALLSSDRTGILRPKLQTPEPNCHIGGGDASLGKEILDIPKATPP